MQTGREVDNDNDDDVDSDNDGQVTYGSIPLPNCLPLILIMKELPCHNIKRRVGASLPDPQQQNTYSASLLYRILFL